MTIEVGGFGVCNWFPEHGEHLVLDSDRAAFAALIPAGMLFRRVGSEGDWITIKYGDNIYRVNPSVLKTVSAPAFEVGQNVVAKGKEAKIIYLGWHFKDARPIYLVEFDGKRSSRRYSEQEISAQI